MAKQKLPKKLYVKWNTDGEDSFLEPSDNPEYLAEQGETIEAGIYELKSVVKLVNATEVIKK